MEFVIKPYESVGPIKLGMTKEEIRSVMPEAPEDDHYFRGPYTDHFVQMSFFAYYTGEDGVCEATRVLCPVYRNIRRKANKRGTFYRS